MHKITRINPEQKNQLALFAVLALSSIISIAVYVNRNNPSDIHHYDFLVWNLFLAWVPLGFSWVAYTASSTHLRKPIRITVMGICAILWLVFFPNSLYIMTDYEHLALAYSKSTTWYDVLMLNWFSWSGLFLGIASLYFMQKIVARRLGSVAEWLFVVAVTAISSLGIYTGRFLRWNSWDIFLHPVQVITRVSSYVYYTKVRTTTFSLLLGLFFLFIYVTILLFARLISQQTQKE
jgi:uncharacterized membrane protein